MKIKMLTAIAGEVWSARCGDIIEVTAKEGKRFCAAGLAEPVRQIKPEKAVTVK